MDYKNSIAEFVSERVGGICISEEPEQKIVYADWLLKNTFGGGEDILSKNAADIFPWMECSPSQEDLAGGRYEWEFMDIKTKKYWKINSGLFTDNGRLYRIEQVTDVTDYMSLSSEVTKYMSFFKRLSAFQSEIFMRLSDNYYSLLPLITDFMKVPRVYFWLQRGEFVEIITYQKKNKSYNTYRDKMSWIVRKILEEKDGTQIPIDELPEVFVKAQVSAKVENGYSIHCLCTGKISEQEYAIYVEPDAKTIHENMQEQMILNVIRLYLENSIMRENLIYAGEHDAMTGLYNKGKYLERLEKEYQTMKSIGIFNMDVNNLKKMNDTYGHEAGDLLLIKAADSIRSITSNDIHGYRMGGDEYLVILCNPKPEDMEAVQARWEEALDKLNEENDGIECIIAVGSAYGEGNYQMEQLMQLADRLMYEDKKRKKKPGEEIR